MNSGRLYLAIFRWNFYPQYANGSVSVLVDYVSPLQVAVQSSSIEGTSAGSAQHPVVVTATQASSALPNSATLDTGSAGTVTTTGYLPVLNITGLTTVACSPSTHNRSPAPPPPSPSPLPCVSCASSASAS